jgi:hypothetical protein
MSNNSEKMSVFIEKMSINLKKCHFTVKISAENQFSPPHPLQYKKRKFKRIYGSISD